MDNYSKYTFVFDVDGTLCPIKSKDEKYEDLVPFKSVVEKIQDFHSKGAKIVIFSSRNMRTYSGNLGLINKYTAKTMEAWLERWGIPYDEILFGKPWPGHDGFYVDDRTIRPDEFVKYSPEELESICSKSRDIK
jgi:capsule biosynthesis phosphatase